MNDKALVEKMEDWSGGQADESAEAPIELKVGLTPATSQPATEVRLIVTGTDGEVYYTIGGTNPELASVLAKQSMMPDWPVKKQPAKFMALGRDLYRVDRQYLLSVIGTFCTADYQTISAFSDSIPETALLTLEVVR